RKQRENRRILWADTLPEARNLAVMLGNTENARRPVRLRPQVPTVVAATSPASQQDAISLLASQVDQLNEQLTRVEAAIDNIDQSRTWRARVRMGGLDNTSLGRSA